MMSPEREDRTALVTASSAGIGLAVAAKLRSQGFHLVVNGRTEDRLAVARSSLAEIQSCGEILSVAGDLLEAGTVDGLIDQVRRIGAPLRATFVNTPTPTIGLPESLTPRDWDDAIRGLVRFPELLISATAKTMAARGGGSLVVNASCSATVPIDARFHLANTLRAVSVAQAKAYARRFIRRNVRINAILTGYVDTALTRGAAADAAHQEVRGVEDVWRSWELAIPLGRFAQTREIAEVAAFLLGPESGYIVGVALPVDGGLSMMHSNF